MHVIIKAIYPPIYNHNDFVVTHTVGHMKYGQHKVHEVLQCHCGDGFYDYMVHGYMITRVHDFYDHMYLYILHSSCKI